ncbi:hypothetical protein EJ05DRAFT_375240 [Pseudovirgaria hyperparasitica]|uniref:SLS1 C-terminal domain-containing protein n=1 Tax=Pseudovirgaria hyperparasitica TaxID=470096 RepID=A0A6A6W8X0_9PEZI|nr:uncharacterized protein EJ05DRAFT_375240 [Pseudovirgaria hyperparasitica]KAF2758037.1 hypothetical protein EJ05DRAFT_375240 [Pseudovirgaria hyperparasitica]
MLWSIIGHPHQGHSILLGHVPTVHRAIIHVSSPQHALSYKDRSHPQGRWVLPVTRKSHTNPSLEPLNPIQKNTSSREALVNMIRTARIPLLRNRQENGNPRGKTWDPNVFQEAFADFGHVLHPITDRVTHESLMRELEERRISHRTFSYTTPTISRVLANLTSRNPPALLSDNRLVLQLIPNPADKKHHITVNNPRGKQYPRIEMLWDVSDKSDPRFKEIRAFIGQDMADYLLPGHAIDVRVTRREFCKSNARIMENRDVQNFVEVVNSSLVSGALLSAPPSIKLRVPEWFASSAHLHVNDYLQNMSVGTTIPIMYVPVGFEYRQRMSFDISIHPLSFTTSIGGATGGNHGRLSLSLGPISEPDIEGPNRDAAVVNDGVRDMQPDPMAGQTVDATEDFIDSVFNLADLIDETTRDIPDRKDSVLTNSPVTSSPSSSAWAAPRQGVAEHNGEQPNSDLPFIPDDDKSNGIIDERFDEGNISDLDEEEPMQLNDEASLQKTNLRNAADEDPLEPGEDESQIIEEREKPLESVEVFPNLREETEITEPERSREATETIDGEAGDLKVKTAHG